MAAYARVSTDHEDQQSSLAAQAEYYKRLITERPNWTFVCVYVDDGISGLGTRNRDGFNRMMEDCLAGGVDLVLTKSISRFARNTVDTVTAIRKMKEKGVAVYFEKENIYSLDSKGEFLLTIMSSLAQEESRSISENVTWGQHKRFADGKCSVGYSRFLGYDKGPEKYQMVVNEEQAVTVRRIFSLFLKGYTSHAIAQILTSEKAITPAGLAKWSAQTVQRILTNEKYKGDALLQKEFTVDYLQKKLKKNEGELPQYYVKEDHEAIISPWLFDYVQKQIERRIGKEQRYSGVSVLSSKVICGVCGATYGPRPWHSTSYNNSVWQCRNRVRKGPKCPAPNIYDRLLHYIIHDMARSSAIKRKVLKSVEKAVLQVISADRARELRKWSRRFAKADLWELPSDEDDLAVAIHSITVMKDGTAKLRWIDGDELEYRLPKYSPSGGIDYDR